MRQFLEFVQEKYPDRIPQKAKEWLTKEQS
jgi:hypothetical protein